MKLLITIIVCLLSVTSLYSQSILDEYIKEGLENNQQLIVEALEVSVNRLQTDVAKSAYLPRLSFEANYTLAGGGRTIFFPVGDIINPVYQSLNQMTESNQFPMIENVNEQFLPNDFHETKLRLIQPLFNSDIYYGQKISSELEKASEFKKQAYEKELVKEIKVAYYNYLQTTAAVEIFESNESSLIKLVEFNQSRFKQDVITKDEVLQADYLLQQLYSNLASARAENETAKAYFNFLLNRPIQSTIIVDREIEVSDPSMEVSITAAWQNRTELQQLDANMRAQENVSKMVSANRFLPKVSAVADAGYQGFGYQFDADQDFWLVNFNLSWNIFSGSENKYKSQISQQQFQQLASKEKQLKDQISIEIIKASSELEAAIVSRRSKEKALDASSASFNIIQKKYVQDQALLIEYTQAQTAYIRSQLEESISKYQVLSKKAQLERALAY